VSVITKNYEHLKEDKRTKKELRKLNRIFKDIPKDKKSLVEKLVSNAAFMAILLDDLQEDIEQNGYKDEYKNGENQYGYKRAVAADLYQVTIKNYTNVIKQLNDLLPKNKDIEDDDGFEAFINSRG
jgi:ribosomal protein RSM22 (predicted rRNA methylase)